MLRAFLSSVIKADSRFHDERAGGPGHTSARHRFSSGKVPDPVQTEDAFDRACVCGFLNRRTIIITGSAFQIHLWSVCCVLGGVGVGLLLAGRREVPTGRAPECR